MSSWAEWCEDHEELIDGLRRHEWNGFLRSLHDQIFGGTRVLSKSQVDTARSIITQYDSSISKYGKEPISRITDIGVSAIEELFLHARKSGLKRPMFRADRVSIKQSRYVGVLYVYDRDAGGERGGYVGKIVGGRFIRTRNADSSIVGALHSVAADPAEAARTYGLSTGTCGMCGRELTDPVSVTKGVGPICASKWGFQ